MRKIVLIISIILFCYKGEAAVRERDSAQVEIVADSMEMIKKVPMENTMSTNIWKDAYRKVIIL